jgi:hypothetical protein
MLIGGQNFGGTQVAKNGGNDWQKNGVPLSKWDRL